MNAAQVVAWDYEDIENDGDDQSTRDAMSVELEEQHESQLEEQHEIPQMAFPDNGHSAGSICYEGQWWSWSADNTHHQRELSWDTDDIAEI